MGRAVLEKEKGSSTHFFFFENILWTILCKYLDESTASMNL